ncbi:MAG: 23S rRNA (adenine(2503)-C(2))-methyltransferase RlmN [Bacteroidales bacterium]|jgi:23S rRNA (adenine2503-C2)-methyltransferase|nr:23S rRNA (adenine(2503)-C(2))-methyltransferase RlmN [Bacteroidales bacterium]
MKEPLLGKTLKELEDICLENKMPKFNAKQIASWLYKSDVNEICQMTNLSLKTREVLSERYSIGKIPHIKEMESKDATVKYLYKYDETTFVETVIIPDKARQTLCISSQGGCKMNCLFCATGKQGFQRNLTSGEIINFVASLPEKEDLSNIVFMGMGEPLDNFNEVVKAIEILTSQWGYAISPRRITLSTCGILPKLIDFIEKTECHIAISMHNPFHEERLRIMPIEKTYPIEEICNMLRNYNWYAQRRLTFEYILFERENDTYFHAKEISRLLRGLNARVNLIPYNPTPNSPFKGASQERMLQFQEELEKFHLITTIRKSKGEDILAACGLLSTKNLEENSSK